MFMNHVHKNQTFAAQIGTHTFSAQTQNELALSHRSCGQVDPEVSRWSFAVPSHISATVLTD